MTRLMEKYGITQLDVEQRLALIEEIWVSIDAEDASAVQMSDAQRAEFESRHWDDELDEEDLQDLWEIEEGLAIMRSRH